MDIVINGLAIDIWPIGGLALVAVLAIQFFRKNSWMYLICSFLFGVYILLGLKEVFFPIHINGDYVNVMRQESLLSRINIIPLYFNQFGLSKGIFINILQNIVLTIPLGFGLNFIKSLRVRNFLVLAFIVGIGIEATQFMISLILGYAYRVIDINDALFNAIGVLLGYALFRIFAWLYLGMTRRFNIEHRGLPAYVYEVSRQA